MFKTLALFLVLIFIVFDSAAQKTVAGIVTDEIKTKNGTVKIIRTAHLPKGKTISGKVVYDAETKNPNKEYKRLKVLGGLAFQLGSEFIIENEIFTTVLPKSETTSLKVFSSNGKLIEEILLELSEPEENIDLKMPKTLRAENVEKITGNFSGNITEAKVAINNKTMNVLAGNESELLFETAGVDAGKNQLSLAYGDVEAIQNVNVVDYTLQAGRLTLNRGESTYLNVNVVGLKDLQEPLQLEVKNQSAGTIAIEGGNVQFFQINPDDVAETGNWEKRFDIQSISNGSFSVYTDLSVSETSMPETEDATKYIEQAIAYEAKVFNIGKMKLVNRNDKPVNAGLQSFYIPMERGHQGYIIPEQQKFTLPPNSESWVDIKGYCTDFELPAPQVGTNLPAASKWFQINDPENIGKIQELMVQEDVRKMTLTGLPKPMNIPGTDIPITHAVGKNRDSELYKRLLMFGLQKIIGAYNQIETEGALNPAFKEGDREKTIQAAFWDYSEKLKGNELDKQKLEDKLKPQLTENLWENIELIGEKAKIYPEALLQVKNKDDDCENQCEYQFGELPGFQFRMKIADSWKDEDDREQIIREARENIQDIGIWSVDSTFYEQEGGLAHNPTSVCAFFNGGIIGGFASSYARSSIATRDETGRRAREWVSSTEQLSINIDTFNIVRMEVIPKPGWTSFVVGSAYVKLNASSSAFDAVAGNAENSLAYLKVIKFAGAVALKYLASGSKKSFGDYAKDEIGNELQDKLEEEAIRQIIELAGQYLDDYSRQTGKTIEEIMGDVISPPDLEEMLERFLGVQITTFDELLDEGIDASLNLLLASNTYCTANGGMVVKIDNASNSGFVYSRAHYARTELEDNSISQTGAIADTFYVSNVRPNSIEVKTTGIASMMARARGNGQADAYLESAQIQVLVGVCKGPAGQFHWFPPVIILSEYKHDQENAPDRGEDFIQGLVKDLNNKIGRELNYRSSQHDWKNVVDEFVRELSQDKFQ